MNKSDIIYNIGQRIKSRREELGMSQQELATRVGYKSRSSINKIELGINDVGQKTLQKIAAALDTTSGVLLDEADFGEQFAVVAGDQKLMALYETLRANAGLIPPLSEDSETVSLHVKSVLDEMEKKGHHVSDMFKLALCAPDSIGVSSSSDEHQNNKPHVNTIRIAGRNGSLVERQLTDEQLALFQSMLDQMKPIDDESV